MPLTAGIVNQNGNLPNEVNAKLSSLFAAVDKQVAELAQQAGLPPSRVRLLRPCNLAVLVGDYKVFVILTNINAGGIVTHTFIDWRGKPPIDLSIAIHLAERDLSFEEASGFEFSAAFIEATEEDKIGYAHLVANSYMNEEMEYLDRLNRIVKINPIFQGRDFLVNQSLVFMLSPFSEPYNAIYEDHIKPTVEGIPGLRCQRADNIYDNRSIMEDIWTNINEAGIIIAELTGRNPNVFYETGIAHTVGKEVILIAQTMEDVPFDLRHLRCIVYDYTPRGVQTLQTNLTNTIQTILNRR
ncbi:hypothetical protein [Aneurinibacillus tyrosinisolvens]|uniref:hypothetical protein n=1 Tax=Aneurinibacillus tyrosinisolvens TaxID=1443435 RepID=UPI00069925A7|nr:hypothetical protein [Aneurinibacillus tyrosinisolvens]